MQITIENTRHKDDLRQITDGMRRHTMKHVPWEEYDDLTVMLRDESGRLVGAALGRTGRGWLHLDVIWVQGQTRGSGHGTSLLEAAEKEAVSRGCRAVFLDTFSYQARPFYEKNGYKIFGTLDECPPGHKRYFMRKGLAG